MLKSVSRLADYLVKDYAREVTASKLLALEYGKMWYAPLNIIYNPWKEKFRKVCDARAEDRGVLFNSKYS